MLLTTALIAALTPAAHADPSSALVAGTSAFADATTTFDGSAWEAETPDRRSHVDVDVMIYGEGEYEGVDLVCSLFTEGGFEGAYWGDGHTGEDGRYRAEVGGESSLDLVTGLGCALDDILIDQVLDVGVRAELQATSRNCEGYCSAQARLFAESECGVGDDMAMCWADAEAEAMASCELACNDVDHVIVAETWLSAGQMARFEDRGIEGGVFGHLRADLTYDRVEDGDGDEVETLP